MFWPTVHLMLHIIVPGAVARLAFRPRWQQAWAIMVSTMLIDLDHLLANPIYDPTRCGIGFHPLHSFPAIALYIVLMLIPQSRIIGAGLVIHMTLDGIDCL